MATLVELLSEANRLEQMLFESGGEITPDAENALALTGRELKQKVDSYCAVIESAKQRREYALQRLKEWQHIASICDKTEENLKTRLSSIMKTMGLDSIHGYEHSLSFVTNPPKVVVVDENLIPGDLIISEVSTRVDKKLALERMKNGENIPGLDIQRETRLSIRTTQRKISDRPLLEKV